MILLTTLFGLQLELLQRLKATWHERGYETQKPRSVHLLRVSSLAIPRKTVLHSLALLSTAQLVLAISKVPTIFDCVIVQDITAELIIANRLPADPTITVVAIEAGDSAFINPNVTHVPKSFVEFGFSLRATVK